MTSNLRGRRIVGTIKHAITNSIVQNLGGWAEVLPQVLYNYFRLNCGPIPSPSRGMYGINPSTLASNVVALLSDAGPHHKLLELLGESGVNAAAAAKFVEPKQRKRKEMKFAGGHEVLVAHGPVSN